MSDKSLEWLLKHKCTVGSTAAGTVVGLNPYQSTHELWDDMFHAITHKSVLTKATNGDMKRGILTEPIHRELLQESSMIQVYDHDQDEFVYDPKKPWAHTLPDGWVDFEGKRIPLQLKCPRPQGWQEIKLSGIHGYWLLGTQHSMAVTNTECEYFSVLNPVTMELIHFPVYRDDDLIKNLMEIEERFYHSLLTSTRPDDPEPIDLPETSGEMVTIDTDDARTATESYLYAAMTLREAQVLQDVAKSKLKNLMGECEVVQFPGLRCYNRVIKGRRTIDPDKMERDNLDVSRYEKKGNPFKQFRAYPKL